MLCGEGLTGVVTHFIPSFRKLDGGAMMSKKRHSTYSWETSSGDIEINNILTPKEVRSNTQDPLALKTVITEVCHKRGK